MAEACATKVKTMRRTFLLSVCLLGLAVPAAAQAPVAVVEDVKGKVAGVEFMDYVAPGKVIKLGPKDSIVLGYMKSCWRETITGGTVVIGEEASLVHGGRIERGAVGCDPGRIQLSEREAAQSAATVVRSMSTGQAGARPPLTLFGASPMVHVKTRGALVVERIDQAGERHEIALRGKALVRGQFYDFARAGTALTPGATYVARLGDRKTLFRIDQQAQPGPTPIVGRLVHVP
jgi:hypothetical protein